jgi:hypothetical protein
MRSAGWLGAGGTAGGRTGARVSGRARIDDNDSDDENSNCESNNNNTRAGSCNEGALSLIWSRKQWLEGRRRNLFAAAGELRSAAPLI